MKSAVVTSILFAASVASANPRALPFTYTTDTLSDGAVEIEQYVDMVPRRADSVTLGENKWILPSAFQTEIEIGIADRLELGLYLTYVPALSSDIYNEGQFPGMGTGLKQRLRYIFADQNEWPVDVGVYGEVTESEREIELEGKILLQKRFGDFRIAANLSSEWEYYFATKQREFVLNPSAGITYELSARTHLGIDSWLRGEYPTNPKPPARSFGLGPQVYVGPAVMHNFGKLWWAVGAYVRVTDFDHSLKVGEPYGPVYVRSMIGYDL